jgi:hypothetical protein
VAGSCEFGNETSCSINGGEFLNKLSEHYFRNENSALWS